MVSLRHLNPVGQWCQHSVGITVEMCEFIFFPKNLCSFSLTLDIVVKV